MGEFFLLAFVIVVLCTVFGLVASYVTRPR